MSDNNKLGLWVLTALVVGNMVGSGIFMLPRTLAEAASPAGVLGAWGITGLGVLFIAFVFGNLALRKPHITGGPQMYAKDLFAPGSERGILSGYMVSWGYWIACWAGNVAIITTFASYLSTFFPVMGSQTPFFTIGSLTVRAGGFISFLVCSILLWGIHFLVLRGVEGTGKLNFIATTAKVLGFLFFIIIGLAAFEASNLVPFYELREAKGSMDSNGFFGQLNAAAIATLWAFLGVESSVVFSARAKRKRDVRTSTILGLLLALAIYIGITLLVMGILPQDQLIKSEKPLVDALSVVFGNSASYVMAGLALISLIGTTIGWILLSAEMPYQAAKQGIFPPQFLGENKKGAPRNALILTNIMTQLFIFSTISQSMSKAFDFVIFIATLAYLIPYLISSIYQLKLVITGDTYDGQSRQRSTDGIIAVLATAYSLWVIVAGTADLQTFLLGVGLLVSGLLFYPSVRKEYMRNKEYI